MGFALGSAWEAFVSLEREAERMSGCRGGLWERRVCTGREESLKGQMGGCRESVWIYHGGGRSGEMKWEIC